MFLIDDILVTDELATEQFVCDLSRCKGACCVEGDLGAPLEEDELKILEEIFPKVEPWLPEAGRKAIREQGAWIRDKSDELSTPLVDGKECAYTVFTEEGVAGCGIEKAYEAGEVDFKKPISCHLYPVRVIKSPYLEALNYNEWSICSDACSLGQSLKVPVYKFVKVALIRRYGEAFYEALEAAVGHLDTPRQSNPKRT